MQNIERKNKYLGFRIGYADYMQTLEAAGRSGVSVTDFILSVLLPAINKFDKKIIIDNNELFTKEEKNIIPVKTIPNDTLEALKQKEKMYIQKLKSI